MKEKNCSSCQRKLPELSPGNLCPVCVLEGARDSSPMSGIPALEDIQVAFPNFVIHECIGRGGMGIVYRATVSAEDREVALKVLDPSLSDQADFAERFEREARMLGQLSHPHIVSIFDHGKNEAFFWLTMEFVDGVNLRQAMRTSQFTPEQALEIIPDLCSALQFAHENAIYHRDIKPENILLTADGKVKVVDFGIARLMGDQAEFTLTRTGSALGSTAYMAPEQIESPQDVDHRADIYSLGVVFYEMLTGSLPLGRFPAPSEKTGSYQGLDEIVFRALEKEREKRFQNASDIPHEVRTASHETSVKEQSSARRWTNTAMGLWLVGLLTAIVGATIRVDLLSGIGAIAALVGLPMCWWLLIQVGRGNHPRTEKLRLILASVVPMAFVAFLVAVRMSILSQEEERIREAEQRDQKEILEKTQKSAILRDLKKDAKAMMTAARKHDLVQFRQHLDSQLLDQLDGSEFQLRELMIKCSHFEFKKLDRTNVKTPSNLAHVLVSLFNEERRLAFQHNGKIWKLVDMEESFFTEFTMDTEAGSRAYLLASLARMFEAAEKGNIEEFKAYFRADGIALIQENGNNMEKVMEEINHGSLDQSKARILTHQINEHAKITIPFNQIDTPPLEFQFERGIWKVIIDESRAKRVR